MKISIIAAMTDNRIIGRANQLPWHLPADLKHFKQLTMGRPIIMGRKTFESIGKVLPGRQNIIITRDNNYKIPDCDIFHSLDTAISKLKLNNHAEIFIIGGAEIYAAALKYVDRLYLTFVHANIPGDTYFPEINLQQWHEISREDHIIDTQNPYPYSFVIYDRS